MECTLRENISLNLMAVTQECGNEVSPTRKRFINYFVRTSFPIYYFKSENDDTKLDERFVDDSVWLTQQFMPRLLQTNAENILINLKKIYLDGEFDEKTIPEDFLAACQEGSPEAHRKLKYSNLDAII